MRSDIDLWIAPTPIKKDKARNQYVADTGQNSTPRPEMAATAITAA